MKDKIRNQSFITRNGAGLMVVLLILVYLIMDSISGLENADTYFHIRVGQELLSGNWKPWHSGHFNSYDHENWVSTQWFSQIIYAACVKMGGLPLLNFLQTLTFIGFGTTIFVILRKSAGLLPSALVTAAFVYGSFTWLTMRPMLYSYMLIAFTAHYWLQHEKRNTVPWLLIPLFWLWAQLHGLWIIGWVATAAFALVLSIKPLFERVPAGEGHFNLGDGTAFTLAWRKLSWKYLIIPPAILLFNTFTLAGPKLWHAIFRLQEISEGYSEFDALSFGDRYLVFLALLMAAAFLGLIYRAFLKLETPTLLEVTIVTLGLGLYLYSGRTIPMGALLIVPSLAVSLGVATRTFNAKVSRKEKYSLIGLMVFAILMGGVTNPTHPEKDLYFPSWYDKELAAMPAGTSIYTENHFATWPLYKYPKIQVVDHGYTDAFTLPELYDRFDIIRLKPGWQDKVKKLCVDYFMHKDNHYLTAAFENEGWKSVKHSEGHVLLKAPQSWLKGCSK